MHITDPPPPVQLNSTSIKEKPIMNPTVYEGDAIPKGAKISCETFDDETLDKTNTFSTSVSVDFNDEENGLEMVPVSVIGRIWEKPKFDGNISIDVDEELPSNERLLFTAFLTFSTFAACQTVAAFIAGSEAMMGDSAAMVVDALTYLFNLIAERRKSRFEEFYQPTKLAKEDPDREKKLKERAKRKMILCLEIIPPIISVTTLVIVIIFVLKDSLFELRLDIHRDRSEQGDPNINLMLTFSVGNLGLDLLNVCCFARANRLFGYEISDKVKIPGHDQSKSIKMNSNYAQLNVDDDLQNDGQFEIGDMNDDGDKDIINSYGNNRTEKRQLSSSKIVKDLKDKRERNKKGNGRSKNLALTNDKSNEIDINNQKNVNEKPKKNEEEEEDDIIEKANLNMCSAYTHVFADTLRSLAVIAAATFAEFSEEVTSEEADATAAVAVSMLILISLVPLFNGLVSSLSELLSIQAEERDEKISSEGRIIQTEKQNVHRFGTIFHTT